MDHVPVAPAVPEREVDDLAVAEAVTVEHEPGVVVGPLGVGEPRVVPVQRVSSNGTMSPWCSIRYSSSSASNDSMPATSGSSSAPGERRTVYGSIGGCETNWLPSV